MAVAVKNPSETSAPSLMDRLAARSLLGVLYVLASIGLLYALSEVWQPGFVLLLTVELAAMVAAIWLGVRLLGPQPTPGVRGGIFWGLVALALVAGLTWIVGMILDPWLSPRGLDLVGQVVTTAVGLGLLALVARWYFKPSREEFFVHFEEQGWLSSTAYKRTQGVRVRRGTMAGILLLVAAGIYTVTVAHQALRGDWTVPVPFTGMVEVRTPGDSLFLREAIKEQGTPARVSRTKWEDELEALPDQVRIRNPGDSDWEEGQIVPKIQFEEKRKALEAQKLQLQLPTSGPAQAPTGSTVYQWYFWLLPDTRFTVPLILALGALWVSYRLVNFPPFADFLIATEAELNKVSWTSRARLVQDTVVVLVTLVLFTVFLFMVDAGWSWLLNRINVLPEVKAKVVGKDEKQPW